MLRKTAAIAVLVLMIASLFTGSLGHVQAVAPAKNDAAPYEKTEHFTKGDGQITTRADRIVSFGSPDAVGFAVSEGSGGAVIMGQPTVGTSLIVTHGAAPDFPDDNASGPVVAGYGTMVIYMNDSKVELTGAGWANFMEERTGKGMMFLPPGPMSGEIFIHSKVAMFKPGSASPDMYDLRWERMHTGMPGEFSAHLMIPVANASGMSGVSLWPVMGMLELNTNMTVDLANLSIDSNGTVVDSQYNNVISAGESKWHSADVSAAVKSLNVDLKWQDSDSDLQLVIYTPDGHVLGPYDDSSDGKDDGRINLNVANPSGVASGEWYLKVSDADASGQDAYYMKTY